jgi:ABC transport system ATP-binding/permease protein
MSEEVLRALMELFALIVKQDGGMLLNEKEYVAEFLKKQLPLKAADEYMDLFLGIAGPLQNGETITTQERPSVKDSVKILNLCKTINKTITQEQKVIVLSRCFELINTDRKYTSQRMNIMNTIAEVFRISADEFNTIWQFMREEDREAFVNPSINVFSTGTIQPDNGLGNEPFIVVLRVESVNLFFIRSFYGETLLNGLPMASHKVYPFAPGSSVVTPPEAPIYFSDIVSQFNLDETTHKLTFVASHVYYTFKDGITAIKDFSFSADQGKIVGILGSSGAGKTTLLNILSGLTQPSYGDVRINGISIFASGTELEGVIGYVPQDDLLVEDLTVFENLYYAAALCSGDKTKAELTEMVSQTLNSLGLYKKRNFKVGTPLNKTISGGQRKRLNIALELIREPSVLFLDEPTSGLSSRDSENIMELMHELARKNKLIITVVHQPSSEIFKGFDKIIIIDQEGELVYSGNPIEAILHFKTLAAQINNEMGECPTCGNVNPEVIFDILESRVIDEFGKYTDRRKVLPSEWAEAFRKRHAVNLPPEETSRPYSTLRRPGWLKQTALYLTRDLKSKLADKQYLLLIVLEAPVLGFILSYIIKYIADPSSSVYIFRENENIPIYIFMSVIVALFLGLTVSAEEIFRDRKMVKREHFLHLNRSSYLIAKIIVMVIISAAQTTLFLAIANPMLEIRGIIHSYWIALFVTSLCANMIGLNISSAFSSAISIYVAIPILMIPMMVLSGAMFPFDKLNRKIGNIDKVPVIAELMPTRWTYEALMVNQAIGNEYDIRVYALKKEISIADFNSVYRLSRLNDALDLCIKQKKFQIAENIEPKLNLLQNELRWLSLHHFATPFPGKDSLTLDLFTPELGERLKVHLEEINNDFIKRGNLADDELDRYIAENKQSLKTLFDDYHNDKLEEIVRKIYEPNKILEYNGKLIQNIDPIYEDPYPISPLDFRCHFLSPVKKFMGFTFGTFFFNISLVLISVVILYFMLYYETLLKIVTSAEKIRIQKR